MQISSIQSMNELTPIASVYIDINEAALKCLFHTTWSQGQGGGRSYTCIVLPVSSNVMYRMLYKIQRAFGRHFDTVCVDCVIFSREYVRVTLSYIHMYLILKCQHTWTNIRCITLCQMMNKTFIFVRILFVIMTFICHISTYLKLWFVTQEKKNKITWFDWKKPTKLLDLTGIPHVCKQSAPSMSLFTFNGHGVIDSL